MDFYSSLNASGLDPEVPTLFELLSAQQLQDLISPSLRYIVSFYAQRHPGRLLRIANRFDELYLVCMGIVEYYHLNRYNASFTEKFYGLKRARSLNTRAITTRSSTPSMLASHTRLTRSQVWGSLFFVMVVPYIKEKLEARYQVLHARQSVGSLDVASLSSLDRALLKWYPRLSASSAIISVAFYTLFLFGKSSKSSIVDLLLSTKYSRMAAADYDLGAGGSAASTTTTTPIKRVKDTLLGALSFTLPASMFLLKFLEWWHASDFARQMSKTTRDFEGDENLPLPDIISRAPTKSSNCPLCSGPINNPTATETGVVYCYMCIFRYLENAPEQSGGRCPVTGQRLLGCKFNLEKNAWDVSGLRRIIV